jgi:hypothetical protein
LLAGDWQVATDFDDLVAMASEWFDCGYDFQIACEE